eukprot:15468714-Alexandrium_andersonii.AAC.1
MAMGDSEHLRYVDGGGPLGWTNPTIHDSRATVERREAPAAGTRGESADGESAGAAHPEAHVVCPSVLNRSPVATGL